MNKQEIKNYGLVWWGLLFVVLAIAMIALGGCVPTPPPPTSTPVVTVQPTVDPPTPVPTLDPLDWETHPTTDTWPSEVAGLQVCYVRVVDTKEPLRKVRAINNGGRPIFAISTVKDLRPGVDGITAQRVIAKYGNYIMVYSGGDSYSVPDKACRPFIGDGGNLGYLVMHEQTIDGIHIGSHPDVPLYIIFSEVENFDPWN